MVVYNTKLSTKPVVLKKIIPLSTFLTKITEFSYFGTKIDSDRIFSFFFSYWRWVPGTHLTKTEFLAVVSKIAKLPQIFILDSKGFFAIFGTVTSSFSMGNRLLANFPY